MRSGARAERRASAALFAGLADPAWLAGATLAPPRPYDTRLKFSWPCCISAASLPSPLPSRTVALHTCIPSHHTYPTLPIPSPLPHPSHHPYPTLPTTLTPPFPGDARPQGRPVITQRRGRAGRRLGWRRAHRRYRSAQLRQRRRPPDLDRPSLGETVEAALRAALARRESVTRQIARQAARQIAGRARRSRPISRPISREGEAGGGRWCRRALATETDETALADETRARADGR